MSIYVITLKNKTSVTITVFSACCHFTLILFPDRAKWSDWWEKTAESSPAGFELLQVWRGRDNFLPLYFLIKDYQQPTAC